MEGVLWYVLASSRGGPTRTELVKAIDEHPQNANQLAEALGYDYTTIRHHLDVLVENNVVQRAGDGYGDVYLLSEQVKANRETLEEVLETVESD